MLALAVLYWMVVRVATPERLAAMSRAALYAASIAGFYGVLQYSGYELFERMPLVERGRVWSSLGNPLYLGALCAMACPIAIYFILETKQQVTGPKRIISVGALLCIVSGLVLSLSRSAWLGTAIAVGIMHHQCAACDHVGGPVWHTVD